MSNDAADFRFGPLREKWCDRCRQMLVSDRNTCPACGLTLVDAKAIGEQPRVWWPAAEKPR